MNTTKSGRRGGMVYLNEKLSAIAGQPATLAQLMLCFQTNAALRRAWKNARSALVVAPPAAQLQPLPATPACPAPPAPPAPAPAPLAPIAPIAPAQPAQPAQPAAPQWSETGGKFGSGKWG